MSKNWIKYIVLIAVAGLLVYNSVYFKKLDAKKEAAGINLNPSQFALQFWTAQFTPYLDSAVEINGLMKLLKEDPKGTFNKYSKTQGIGNASYFLVKGEGLITAVHEDEVMVAAVSGAGTVNVKLNTGVYFGNAVRDVTGKISMGDFANTMDYNSVSTELNKIVHTQIVLPFKTKAVKDATVMFVGCAEIGQDQTMADYTTILPFKINIIK